MGSADVPGILGSSAGFLRGTSGLRVMALDVALIGSWQTLCVTNLRQMEPEHSAGHSRHRRGHPLTVRLGKLRQSSQKVPFLLLSLLSLAQALGSKELLCPGQPMGWLWCKGQVLGDEVPCLCHNGEPHYAPVCLSVCPTPVHQNMWSRCADARREVLPGN